MTRISDRLGKAPFEPEDAADRLRADDVQHLQRVRAAAQRMATLIDELLGLSRASRQELHFEDADLSATASEVLAELHEANPEREVETVVAPGMRAEALTSRAETLYFYSRLFANRDVALPDGGHLLTLTPLLHEGEKT